MKLLLGELEIHDSQLATNPSLMIDRIWKKKLDLIMNYTVYVFFLVRGGNYPHITQVAASVVGSGKEFSQYVYPKVPIACSAQQITGIIHNNSGTMTVHGQQVHAEKLKTAICKFCSWLRKHTNVYLVDLD